MKPHCNNACSGRFNDWLEVNLLPDCNANCKWCIEKKGWHPTTTTTWQIIAEKIKLSNAKNVVLLGGEPTLYPHLQKIISQNHLNGIKSFVTTNGSKLSQEYVEYNLQYVTGVNISIHHYNLLVNKEITNIMLDYNTLHKAINTLQENGTTVRLNCNCIKNYIDSKDEILNYILTAKQLGVNSVRFAELKDDDQNFVFINKIIPEFIAVNLINPSQTSQMKIPDYDPFINGCSINTSINGMPVNLRLMCGLQSKMRPEPVNPEQTLHSVLYYDGNMYQGWQIRGNVNKGDNMSKNDKKLTQILEQLKNGTISITEAALEIDRLYRNNTNQSSQENQSAGGCAY